MGDNTINNRCAKIFIEIANNLEFNIHLPSLKKIVDTSAFTLLIRMVMFPPWATSTRMELSAMKKRYCSSDERALKTFVISMYLTMD